MLLAGERLKRMTQGPDVCVDWTVVRCHVRGKGALPDGVIK